MPQLLRHQFIIVALGATLLFTNLGGARLWDRDEPRNAGCAMEMMSRQDWVVPIFNGELRGHKPVLLYWFMMTAYWLFGVNEFAARFWSAVLGLGTALATYGIGRRLFHPEVGLWAGVALLTGVMFDVAGRAATPDSVLIFFCTMAMLVFVLGTFRARTAVEGAGPPIPRRPGHLFPSWPVALLMYVLLGVGILAKGPVALVLPTAVLGMFLLITRLPASGETTAERSGWWSWLRGVARPFAPLHFLKTCWFMRPMTALLVALAVALPWYIWVGLRTDGEWLRVFFLEHHVGRTLRPMEGHGGTLLYYPAAVMLGFFPWSVLLVPAVVGMVKRIRQQHPWHVGYLFAACWVGVYLVLFTLARTKLPSYITPCYPGLALLMGCFVYQWRRGQALAARGWIMFGVGALAVIGMLMSIAVPLIARQLIPGEEMLGLVGAIPLLGGIFCIVLARRGQLRQASLAFAGTAFLMMFAVFGWATLRVDRHRALDQLLGSLERLPQSERLQLGALGCLEPSWVFYSNRVIYELRPSAGENPGPWLARKLNWRPRPRLDAKRFLQGGRDHVMITTERQLKRLGKLPPDYSVIAEAPYFLENERLLLVGSNATARRTAEQPAKTGPSRRR